MGTSARDHCTARVENSAGPHRIPAELCPHEQLRKSGQFSQINFEGGTEDPPRLSETTESQNAPRLGLRVGNGPTEIV